MARRYFSAAATSIRTSRWSASTNPRRYSARSTPPSMSVFTPAWVTPSTRTSSRRRASCLSRARSKGLLLHDLNQVAARVFKQGNRDRPHLLRWLLEDDAGGLQPRVFLRDVRNAKHG